MTLTMRNAIRSLLRLAAGEVGARLASFMLFAYISRRLGVETLGAVALAQTIATYITYCSDQGARMIGARLVARDASSTPLILRQVECKRIILTLFSVAAGSAYALWGPVPTAARMYVLCFVVAVLPYAFSLDWLAWGLNRFGWLGSWRTISAVILAVGSIAGIQLTGHVFMSITLANAASVAFGSALLWCAWRWLWRRATPTPVVRAPMDSSIIVSELRWGPVFTLGLASILNLVFNNFDTVMLGAMSTTAEVGRYSAAYKVLFLIFSAYCLLTNSLYPQLARAQDNAKTRRLMVRGFVFVTAAGSLVALLAVPEASLILRLVYGSDLNAARLLTILLWVIPLDFCGSLMGTVLVSRGFNRAVLLAAGAAALVNIGMNWILIPRMHAEGAAWATVGAYVFRMVLYVVLFWRTPVFGGSTSPAGRLGESSAV